jgi:hypothetical protein
MPRATRAVSRKDFLKLSGAGLAGAALLGTTGCGGGQGSDEVIKYLTETPETTNLERTAIEDLVPEAPKTVDELREIADDLKGQGKIPFAFGDSERWPAGHLFSMAASNLLGKEGLDEILYGDGRWDVPEVEKAIDLMFRDFVESGYYPEGVNAIEPRWVYGKRKVVEPDGLLGAYELADRVCRVFDCPH